MASAPASTAPSGLAPLPLPPTFLSIESIRALPNDDIKKTKMVNVIGFIKDFQAPVPTGGSDPKCTLTIIDPSIRYDTRGLRVNIFWPANRMPTAGRQDVIIIRKCKVQMYRGDISLLANLGSEFYLMSHNAVPSSIDDTATAEWRVYRHGGGQGRPSEAETRYVISMNRNTEDMEMPSDQEYEQKAKEAMNVKDKFSLLEAVVPGKFYNIMCQVVKLVNQGYGELVTVYLSDYTENENFLNYVYGDRSETGRDGDIYGYADKKTKPNNWQGPFGKRTIQLTAWDAHADFIRNDVKLGDWVLLLNVQIKYGKEGGKLEGFLRTDLNNSHNIRVEIMKATEDRSQVDPRYKAALQRQREYEKTHKQEIKRLEADADALISDSKKRKNDEDSSKNNSKKRRKEKREKAFKDAEKLAAKLALGRNLNENIRSNRPDHPITFLKDILQARFLAETNEPGPYDFACYKVNVRVVDYYPHKLEDFSVGYQSNDMDILSDYSGDEDTDHEEDMRKFRSGKGFGDKKWDWRFALQLEDANSQERLWVVVNNQAAQCLLDLDAANLRSSANKPLLNKLREQMFKLWGELEERTLATLLQPPTTEANRPPTSSFDSFNSSPPIPTLGGQPPIDSDDEYQVSKPAMVKERESSVLKERDPNLPTTLNDPAKPDTAQLTKNKAFTCCIRQYAYKVGEDDPLEADAGPGKRWQRMFGLFDTTIL